MNKSFEAIRRKEFRKAAREVIALWPGYARPLPPATNATDAHCHELLAATQAALISTWLAAREDKATATEFGTALGKWAVERIRSHSRLCIKGKL